ncbi:MAG: hypothetical protein ACK5U8_17985 [Deltaproteobacteria bacterium]
MRVGSLALGAPVLGALLLGPPTVALADERVGFGNGVLVGTNVVGDSAVSFGGSVSGDGDVRGDVTSLGGSVVLGPHAHVHGDVASFGGSMSRDPRAQVDGQMVAFAGNDTPPSWSGPPMAPHRLEATPSQHGSHGGSRQRGWLARGAHDMFESLIAHGLLFLLALVLSGLFPERMTNLHKAIIREPMRSGALGLGSYVAAVVLIVALTITILGIPAAVVLAFGMPIATYVGLAACATVIGAALPSEKLSDRPILRLAAGVGVLFAASLVPFVGPILVAVIACVGVGALVRTRFRTDAPRDLEHPPQSAYR